MTKADQPTSGTDILRLALKAHKLNTALIARDELGIPGEHLAAFVEGHRTLPPDVLCKLATHIFNGSAEYVPELDKLRAISTAPTMTMAVYPPRWTLDDYVMPVTPTRGPVPEVPVPPLPTTRPGWV